MGQNVAQKLIAAHLVSGQMTAGREIGLHIDQTLTQDATGTLVMLELEALGLGRVRTEVAVQYVDHNLLQTDSKNAEDHEFLQSACQRFGLWYSKPGSGVSSTRCTCSGSASREDAARFGQSHASCRSARHAGDRAGGLEVALAMAGDPFHLRCQQSGECG